VTLTGSWTGTQIAGATKSMLDGLVSALHCHDGSNPDVLRPRLTASGDPSEMWHMLCDSSTAVLGRRTLIRAPGSRLAWNPADHLCTAFRVRVRSGGTRGISAVVRAVPG
jgi:hypothetical protein